MKTETQIKKEILTKLFETSSVCAVCGATNCYHIGPRELLRSIPVHDVLKALDMLGKHFNGGKLL